jgi:glutamyl/glutaminyl-tRNA synthetase
VLRYLREACDPSPGMTSIYRGRIAPSPTGYLHLGHAMTFWRAQERARGAGGRLVLRIEDLDRNRCRAEFSGAIIEDLHWFGLEWDEGPDIGGNFASYLQSQRRRYYLDAWKKLRDSGWIYACKCSRKDVAQASLAPHETYVSLGERHEGAAVSNASPARTRRLSRSAAEKPAFLVPQSVATPEVFFGEPIYPGTCRSLPGTIPRAEAPGGTHWRFRVPDGERFEFVDGRVGKQSAVAGRDFGDFVVWRCDDVPAYQLAVVVDDAAMRISEVVRGEDLLMSTFRQLLLYRALKLRPPKFFHTPLVLDESGKRLTKRHGSLSLRALRESGATTPEELRSLYSL